MVDRPTAGERWEYALVWSPSPEGDRFRLVAKSSRGQQAVWDEWTDTPTAFVPTKQYLVDVMWRASTDLAERSTHLP